MKPIIAGSLAALTAVSLTANVLMYLRYSSTRPLVTVGSQVISKKDYQDAVDYQTQGAVLKKLVLQGLITQAAAKAGVTPTTADVDARIADLQRRAPQLLAGATGDAGKMAALKDNLKTDMALENLRIRGVTATDAEVAAFYNSHRGLDPRKNPLALPIQVQTAMVVAENSVDAAQAAALLRQQIGMDVIARQPRLHVVGVNGFNVNLDALPPALNRSISSAVFRMHPGEVQMLPVGKDYLVMRATKSSGAGVPPLDQIRPQVTRLVKLDKAIPAVSEVAALYQASKPQFSVAKYESYFNDLSQMDVKSQGRKTASAQ